MGLQTLIVLSSTLSVFDINICKKIKNTMSILQILKPKIYDITILASYTFDKRCKTIFIIIHNIAIYQKKI